MRAATKGAVAIIVIAMLCFAYSTYVWQREGAYDERALAVAGTEYDYGRLATTEWTDQYGNQHTFTRSDGRGRSEPKSVRVEFLPENPGRTGRQADATRFPPRLYFTVSSFVFMFGLVALYGARWDVKRNPDDTEPGHMADPPTFEHADEESSIVWNSRAPR